MKKLLVVSVLIGVLTMSLPVMAKSPSAGDVLTPSQQQEVTTQAAGLLSSGVVTTPAAANAVATSLVRIKDAKALTTKAISAEAMAIYNSYSAEMKAFVQQVAAQRGLSIEEVIGNFIKADASAKGSKAIAWNANTCLSAVDGKSGNVHVVISRTTADISKNAIDTVGGAKFINVFNIALSNGKAYKTIDTGFNVEGVTANDNAATIGAKQFYEGAWHDIAVTGVAKNAVALHIEHVGPIMIYRK